EAVTGDRGKANAGAHIIIVTARGAIRIAAVIEPDFIFEEHRSGICEQAAAVELAGSVAGEKKRMPKRTFPMKAVAAEGQFNVHDAAALRPIENLWARKIAVLMEENRDGMEFHIGGIDIIRGQYKLGARPVDEIGALGATHRMFPKHFAVGAINPHLAVTDEGPVFWVVENILGVSHTQRARPPAPGFA